MTNFDPNMNLLTWQRQNQDSGPKLKRKLSLGSIDLEEYWNKLYLLYREDGVLQRDHEKRGKVTPDKDGIAHSWVIMD